MVFRQLFDHATSTYTYLIGDAASGAAALVDPVLEQVDRDSRFVAELGLTLRWVLETHVHADHVTSAAVLRERTGCRVALGAASGVAAADRLVADGEILEISPSLHLECRATPGHTDGCTTWVHHASGRAFTGDALLVRGCGRTDFQQGDSRRLYRSVHEKILSLPASTLLFPAHDYQGRTVTSVAEEVAFNPRLGGGRTEDEFVAIMAALKLAPPARIDVAVPANLRLGAA